jgi:hypothetical protein
MKTGSTGRKGLESRPPRDEERGDPRGRWSPDALSWDLPSGKRLAEYALRVRFFTPSLVADYESMPGNRPARVTNQEIGGSH